MNPVERRSLQAALEKAEAKGCAPMAIKPNHDTDKGKKLREEAAFTDTGLWIALPGEEWATLNEAIGPFNVLLDCGSRIWFWATYADTLPESAVHIGDGKCCGYDIHGTRIVSVPAEWCYFMNTEEANSWAMAAEVDAQLLSYAR